MAEVTLIVNGRAYEVACDDGQEERVRSLAAHVGHHVERMKKAFGPVGESRLLFMAAITIAEELFEARRRAPMPEQLDDLGCAGEKILNEVAVRIEALTHQLNEDSLAYKEEVAQER